MTDRPSATALMRERFVALADAVAEVREQVGDPHSGAGGRSIRVSLYGGLTFEVLPERGLDIGSLWYAGSPIAWRSALPAAGPLAGPDGQGWIGSFTGGMLATCGLDNIGPARDGYGLHGSHHSVRAVDVAVTRTPDLGVAISGTVGSASVFGRQVYLHRTITSSPNEPTLTVEDTIVNEGTTPVPVAILYHLNFGAPFLAPGTTVATSAGTHTPRAPQVVSDWRTFPSATDVVGEAVWEHRDLGIAADGRAWANVHSPALGLDAMVRWDAQALPRLVQWDYPSRGGWALGIEPTNSPLFGPDRDAPGAGIPVLRSGERLHTGFVLTIGAVPPERVSERVEHAAEPSATPGREAS